MTGSGLTVDCCNREWVAVPDRYQMPDYYAHNRRNPARFGYTHSEYVTYKVVMSGIDLSNAAFSNAKNFRVGDKVEGYYSNDEKWYGARVVKEIPTIGGF